MSPRTTSNDVQHAFLKIIYYTLISIRSTKNSELTFALSDHAHNIPSLISDYSDDTFRYYWEGERPSFIRAMERLDQPVGVFQQYWSVLEKHYETLQ
jgi:hypothetical protein